MTKILAFRPAPSTAAPRDLEPDPATPSKAQQRLLDGLRAPHHYTAAGAAGQIHIYVYETERLVRMLVLSTGLVVNEERFEYTAADRRVAGQLRLAAKAEAESADPAGETHARNTNSLHAARVLRDERDRSAQTTNVDNATKLVASA